MKVVKTISLKFSDEENEILDTTLEFLREFTNSDACQEIDCHNCPFESLCEYNTAESIERKINNLLCE